MEDAEQRQGIEVYDMCEDLRFYKWFGFYCLGENPEEVGDDSDGIPPLTCPDD